MNLAASVNQRLRNLRCGAHPTFEQLLREYIMERFLFRLAESRYHDRFVLKGALLFRLWAPERARATLDVDLAGRVHNDPAGVLSIFGEVCSSPVSPDGLTFEVLPEVESIVHDAAYEGLRVKLVARLGQARIILRVDIGFGDPIIPTPVQAEYPSLLDMPCPLLLVYPRETAVAEKLHALISRGLDNSRVKDYYDLWLLAQAFAFDAASLHAALAATCAYRGTPVPVMPEGLTAPYAALRQQQWGQYLQRNVLQAPDLSEVVHRIADFAGPVVAAVAEQRPFAGHWPAGGPWTRP